MDTVSNKKSINNKEIQDQDIRLMLGLADRGKLLPTTRVWNNA